MQLTKLICSALLLLLVTHFAIAETEPSAPQVTPEASSAKTSSPRIIKLDVWLLMFEDNQMTFGHPDKETPKDVDSLNKKLDQLRESGKLKKFRHISGTTIDGQELRIQIGSREPRINGIAHSPRGKQTSVQFEDVGIILLARCEMMNHELVKCLVQFEVSELDKSDVPLDADEQGKATVNAASVSTISVRNTVASQSGQVVMLSGLDTKTDDGKKERVIVLLSTELLN